jgi:hypothetical protein
MYLYRNQQSKTAKKELARNPPTNELVRPITVSTDRQPTNESTRPKRPNNLQNILMIVKLICFIQKKSECSIATIFI